MSKIAELVSIAPDIAAHIERTYADSGAALLDVPSPHVLAHQVAATHPGLGAAFYRLVADAARECLVGPARAAPVLPSLSYETEAADTQPEPCPGLEFPCGAPATCEYRTRTGSDMETARAVSLWYCPAHYAELTEAPNAD